jgi:UDP-N-acetylglucosamine 2-epimerase
MGEVAGSHVINVGGVMFDAVLFFGARSEKNKRHSLDVGIRAVHRRENDTRRLQRIFDKLPLSIVSAIFTLQLRTRIVWPSKG